jgi:hypothetical protein
LFTGIKGRGESLCFSAIPEISRAIWSAPPPVPAGMTNSMGFVGSQAFAVSKEEKMAGVRNKRQTRKMDFISWPPLSMKCSCGVRLSSVGIQRKHFLYQLIKFATFDQL